MNQPITSSPIQKQVDRQNTEMVNQKLQLQEMSVKLEQAMLRAIDPVMFAFKKGVDPNSDEFDKTACFIGPCWGPDFDEKLAAALEFKVIKNQRGLLTSLSKEFWN